MRTKSKVKRPNKGIWLLRRTGEYMRRRKCIICGRGSKPVLNKRRGKAYEQWYGSPERPICTICGHNYCRIVKGGDGRQKIQALIRLHESRAERLKRLSEAMFPAMPVPVITT